VREALSRSGARRLYMRFFDVEPGPGGGVARPTAPILFRAPLPSGVETVPVVYLANGAFLGGRDRGALAERVWDKVARLAQDGGASLRELQVDCDWSDETRARYFLFVDALRRRAAREGVTLTATIRLHQVKYFARTGVPPVARGMLMFYNMGRLDADAARASIFNAEDAGRYASSVAGYPLPLDLALPIFSWLVQSREGRVVGLVDDADPAEFDASADFARAGPGRWRARRTFLRHGRYFKEGDLLRLEDTGPARTREAAALAARGAGGKAFGTVAFFDLDERRTKNYAASDFDAILRTLR
jgi:hypothetical protein